MKSFSVCTPPIKFDSDISDNKVLGRAAPAPGRAPPTVPTLLAESPSRVTVTVPAPATVPAPVSTESSRPAATVTGTSVIAQFEQLTGAAAQADTAWQCPSPLGTAAAALLPAGSGRAAAVGRLD